MKRRFVLILSSSATSEQHSAFLTWINATYPGIGWWHRVPDTWLFVDFQQQVTAEGLRDGVIKVFPGVFCLVLEASSGEGTLDWAGFGPTKGPLDWFAWIRQNWR